MAGVRAMAVRVRRLEREAAPASPIVRAYGSFDAYAAKVQADIDAGRLDSRDMAVVVSALRAWETNRVWRD